MTRDTHKQDTHTHSQLLGGLLESNPGYVKAMEQMGLASQFFEFLSLEHANNNVHNIRLCRQIVAAGSMPVTDLADMELGEKVRVCDCLLCVCVCACACVCRYGRHKTRGKACWIVTFSHFVPHHSSMQVAAVLEYATHNNVEPFLEPVLELCHAIVQVRWSLIIVVSLSVLCA